MKASTSPNKNLCDSMKGWTHLSDATCLRIIYGGQNNHIY